MLSETRQREKDKYDMISFLYMGSKNSKNQRGECWLLGAEGVGNIRGWSKSTNGQL